MDAVILAAGRGSRLEGISAPYFKPLLVINGMPLIRSAVELSQRFAENIIIVAAPENAAPINHVAPQEAHMVIQRRANGPGDALYAGLRLCTSEYVIVLMADNVISPDDMQRVANQKGNAVGVSWLAAEEAERFTRIRSNGVWVEKVPVTEDDILESNMVSCWVGPIKMNVEEIREAIRYWAQTQPVHNDNIPIGPLFNLISDVTPVEVSCIDIGVPEALL